MVKVIHVDDNGAEMATVEIDDFTIETVYAGIAPPCCVPVSASSAAPPAPPEATRPPGPPAPREDPHPHSQLTPPFTGNPLGHFGKCTRAGRPGWTRWLIREMLEW